MATKSMCYTQQPPPPPLFILIRHALAFIYYLDGGHAIQMIINIKFKFEPCIPPLTALNLQETLRGNP